MCQSTGNKTNTYIDVENALDKVVDMSQSAVPNFMIEHLDQGKKKAMTRNWYNQNQNVVLETKIHEIYEILV